MITANLGSVATKFFSSGRWKRTIREKMQRYLLKSHDVAKKIVVLIGKNKREINMSYWMGAKLYQIFPSFVEMVIRDRMRIK